MKLTLTTILLPILTTAAPFHPPSTSSSLSPLDVLVIRNTIATYAIAVDTKNTTQLASIFTSTATAVFTDPDQTVVGGQAIAAHDLYAFTGLNTFHALSTQKLVSTGVNGTVKATTYFDALIYGADCYAGQTVSASGWYLDTLGKVRGGEEDGEWLIEGREQVYANPEIPFVGNAAIVLGPKCNGTSS